MEPSVGLQTLVREGGKEEVVDTRIRLGTSPVLLISVRDGNPQVSEGRERRENNRKIKGRVERRKEKGKVKGKKN